MQEVINKIRDLLRDEDLLELAEDQVTQDWSSVDSMTPDEVIEQVSIRRHRVITWALKRVLDGRVG